MKFGLWIHYNIFICMAISISVGVLVAVWIMILTNFHWIFIMLGGFAGFYVVFNFFYLLRVKPNGDEIELDLEVEMDDKEARELDHQMIADALQEKA